MTGKRLEQNNEALNSHNYLLRKKVSLMGKKFPKGKLVLTLYNQDQIIHSLQFIGPDGNKDPL